MYRVDTIPFVAPSRNNIDRLHISWVTVSSHLMELQQNIEYWNPIEILAIGASWIFGTRINSQI